MTDQLKALAEAATKGPWVVTDSYYPSFKKLTGPSFQVSVVMYATDLTDADTDKREADLQYIAAANPERILALIAENERLAHSRKDAEPVAKLTFEAAWAEMEKRGYRYGRDALAGVKFGWKLHEDWNTTNPPEADKLLQQALEALEYHIEQTRPILQTDAACRAIRTYLEGKK